MSAGPLYNHFLDSRERGLDVGHQRQQPGINRAIVGLLGKFDNGPKSESRKPVADRLTAGATFYAIVSFQGKLAMTHAAAQQTLKDGELLQQWNQLQEDLAKEARNRNKLVHLTTIFDPSEKRGYLMYPYSDPRKRNIWKDSMLSGSIDIERINELTGAFAQLAVRLEGFTPKIDALTPSPGKPQ